MFGVGAAEWDEVVEFFLQYSRVPIFQYSGVYTLTWMK
jgi:hypothetical protein